MQTVTHSNFGKGTVINQDATNVTIDFDGLEKTLVTKYANLLNEDGTAFYVAENSKANKFQSKSKPTVKVTKVETAEDKIENWKQILLTVNNQYNANTLYKLAVSKMDRLDAKGNDFIKSLINSFYDKNFLSEKQAYGLAKFAVESNQF